jgi:hypothetical protein
MNRFKLIATRIHNAYSKINEANNRRLSNFNVKLPKVSEETNNKKPEKVEKAALKRYIIIDNHFLISQRDKAIFEAGKVHFNKNKSAPILSRDNCDLNGKSKVNVTVNAGLLPLSSGIITMIDLCAESINN